MPNPLRIANSLANIMNGAKPKAKAAPVQRTAAPPKRGGTFDQIGNKLATKSPAARKFQEGFKKKLGGY